MYVFFKNDCILWYWCGPAQAVGQVLRGSVVINYSSFFAVIIKWCEVMGVEKQSSDHNKKIKY